MHREMKENLAKEKLRMMDIIKENAGMVITVGGFIYLLFQFLILPVYSLQFKVDNILENHIKTIQDNLITATAERDLQGKQLTALSEQIIRLTTLIEGK